MTHAPSPDAPREERSRAHDAGSAENFTRLGTLGVEEEFFVIGPSGRPTTGAEELAESNPPPALDGKIDTESYRCIVETDTAICADVDDVREEVASKRRALVDHAARHGYGIAAAGLHPAIHPDAVQIASDERSRELLRRLCYPQARNTTAGLHIHVGVDDADKALWITNEIRWHLPVMLALSANSPFYEGDTGLASARALVFEELPHTGIPTAFDSYEALCAFRETLVQTGSVPDRGQIWWDVRPHPEYGTVEIRAPDAQRNPETVVALAEYARALVRDLAARYEDGESESNYRKEFLDENKWRALRYGHDAEFVDRDEEGVVDLATVVDRECTRLGIDGLRGVLERDSGATVQRRLYRDGGLTAVCDALRLPQTKRSNRHPRPRPTGDDSKREASR